MPLDIPPGYGQAAIEMRNDGDPDSWYITLGLDLTGVGGDYAQAAFSCASAFAETIGQQLHTSTTVVGCKLRVGQDGTEPITVFGGVNIPGTSTAAMLPQNCALIYDKLTNRGGRRGKGRFFMPNVLKEADVNSVGVIDTTALFDFQFQANAFYQRLLDPEGVQLATPPVLLHNTGPGSVGGPDDITGLQVQGLISTQRRRLR